MDGYFQSAIVVNTIQQSNNRNNQIPKAPPFPPTNKEFKCTELNTPDGIYPLLHETFYDTIAPQFATGTRVSVVTHIHATESSEDEDTVTPPSAALPITIHKRTMRNGSTSSIPKTPGSYNDMSELPSSLNTSHNSSLSSLFSKSAHPTSSRSTSQLSTSRGKPKNHLSKTNSTFVLRFIVNENLQKLLTSHSLENDFTFFNIGSSFIWIDSTSKPKEPLSRIVFSKAYPTCHDINAHTQCDDHIDVVIGFSTGDIIWYEPLSCKYVRLNKGGIMVNSEVTQIKWIPGSDDLFIAIFKNGDVLVMDKERDDQAFFVPDPTSWVESEFLALRPHRNSKHNPVSFWKMSEKGLTDLCFSPDNTHLAITGMDGKLRIIDYRNERLTDVFSSYFGKLNCVDWSPDGRYILTGGEDDLVTLWSFMEKRLIARCQGHKSWVTGVAFDRWNCDEHNYRFGSVGEDCKLILWDFSFSALQKPKNPLRSLTATSLPKPAPFIKRNSAIQPERKKSLKNHLLFRGFSSPDTPTLNSSNTNTLGRFRKRSSKSYHPDMSDVIVEDPIKQPPPVLHPPLKRNQAAVLLPTTTKTVHADPCLNILFRENTIVTTDRRGRIRTWGRPQKL